MCRMKPPTPSPRARTRACARAGDGSPCAPSRLTRRTREPVPRSAATAAASRGVARTAPVGPNGAPSTASGGRDTRRSSGGGGASGAAGGSTATTGAAFFVALALSALGGGFAAATVAGRSALLRGRRANSSDLGSGGRSAQRAARAEARHTSAAPGAAMAKDGAHGVGQPVRLLRRRVSARQRSRRPRSLPQAARCRYRSPSWEARAPRRRFIALCAAQVAHRQQPRAAAAACARAPLPVRAARDAATSHHTRRRRPA